MNLSRPILAVVSVALVAAGASDAAPARTPAPAAPPAAASHTSAARPGQDAVRAGFSVVFGEHVVPYRVFLLTARPGQEVEIEARADAGAPGRPPAAAAPSGASRSASSGAGPRAGASDGPDSSTRPGRFVLRTSAGTAVRTAPGRWSWSAPDAPGAHRIVVRRVPGGEGSGGPTGAGPERGAGRAAADSIVLNAVVLVPFSRLEDGRIDGYRIGDYPAKPYRGLERYRRPAGFVRLTRELADLQVSPHFTLGQFPTKRPRTWPKYLVLEERLLLKLEMLVERAAAEGVPASGWRVLSAYRSPWYNDDIGRPEYSRHIYGDAADVYIDRDGDGVMDDIDGDGRVDVRDAGVLHEIVERMDGEPRMRHFLGGLGKYPTTSTHGPFIHLDTRGYRARW